VEKFGGESNEMKLSVAKIIWRLHFSGTYTNSTILFMGACAA